LHYAALLDNLEFVKYLIEGLKDYYINNNLDKANPKIRNDNGERPVDLCEPNSETQKYLLKFCDLTKKGDIKRNDAKFGMRFLGSGQKPEMLEIEHFERLRTELQEIAGHYT
jgi:hypothetical protein